MMISIMSNKLDGLNEAKGKTFKKLKLNEKESELSSEQSMKAKNDEDDGGGGGSDSGGCVSCEDTASGDQRIRDAVDTLVSLANSTTTTPTTEFKSFANSISEPTKTNSNIEIVSFLIFFSQIPLKKMCFIK